MAGAGVTAMPIPSKPQPPNRARTSEGAVRATGAADAEATAAVGPADGHAAAVDAWTAGRAAGTGNERVLQTFETAFAVVWRRANQTLGDITLTAITERVLYHSAALHPLLVGVHVDASGLRTDDLRTRVAAVPRADGMDDAARNDGQRTAQRLVLPGDRNGHCGSGEFAQLG